MGWCRAVLDKEIKSGAGAGRRRDRAQLPDRPQHDGGRLRSTRDPKGSTASKPATVVDDTAFGTGIPTSIEKTSNPSGKWLRSWASRLRGWRTCGDQSCAMACRSCSMPNEAWVTSGLGHGHAGSTLALRKELYHESASTGGQARPL
jgi:hypothetical protein